MAVERDKTVTLPDGRLVSYAECGDPSGRPVLHLHGSPSSRLEIALPGVDGAAARLGIRLIAPDRPGMGLSDPKPRRSILDYPVDVVGIAEALGLSRFAVYGVSGGGPYAIACALKIAHRLRAVGVVAGIAPFDRPEAREGMHRKNRALFSIGRFFPPLLRQLVKRMAISVATEPTTLVNRLLDELPEADRRVMTDGKWRSDLIAAMREAFRRGFEGPYRDLLLASRGWGFALEDVPMVVNLWFGGVDRNVPPAAGHYLARALERSEARVYPEEGHLSILAHRTEEILAQLMATSEREAGRPVG